MVPFPIPSRRILTHHTPIVPGRFFSLLNQIHSSFHVVQNPTWPKISNPSSLVPETRRAFFTSRSQGQAHPRFLSSWTLSALLQEREYMPPWASKAPLCPVPYRQSVNLTTCRFSGSHSLSHLEPEYLPLDPRAQGKCRHDYRLCSIRVKRRHGFEQEPQGTTPPEPSRARPTRHRGSSRPIDSSFLLDAPPAAAHGRRMYSPIKYCIPPVGKGG